MAKKDNYRRWKPAARRLIDEHGSVEEALAYAFPRFADTGLELRLELDRQGAAGLRHVYDDLVHALTNVECGKREPLKIPRDLIQLWIFC